MGLVAGLNTYAYVEGNPLSAFDPDGLAKGRAKPDFWNRPCNKTQEKECRESCEARGKEFESCAVKWTKYPSLSGAETSRRTGAKVSCSCDDPAPAPTPAPAAKSCESCHKVMIFLATAFIVWRMLCD
jgi:hypothetical protein